MEELTDLELASIARERMNSELRLGVFSGILCLVTVWGYALSHASIYRLTGGLLFGFTLYRGIKVWAYFVAEQSLLRKAKKSVTEKKQ